MSSFHVNDVVRLRQHADSTPLQPFPISVWPQGSRVMTFHEQGAQVPCLITTLTLPQEKLEMATGSLPEPLVDSSHPLPHLPFYINNYPGLVKDVDGDSVTVEFRCRLY